MTSIVDDRGTRGPPPHDGIVDLGGRRTMTYRCYGQTDGWPVVALHGTPGSRLKFSGTHEAALRLGLRVIAPDRWAYGGTSPHPSPTLAGFARDMACLADALKIERFAVMGVSGGGPYAAATAAVLPDRVAALALIAPVGPVRDVAAREMTRLHRLCFGPLARRPRIVSGVFRSFHHLLRRSPRWGLRVGMANVPIADRRVLSTPGVAERLTATFIEGLKAGGDGPATDLALFAAPWNVPLGDARMPARLWLGTADRNVPLAAARRLAAALPDCAIETLAGEGHLWVALHYADILDWLAKAGRP